MFNSSMSTLIRRIIKGLVAPSVAISCSPTLWANIVTSLNERSGGVRESGAFLLGKIDDKGHRLTVDYVLYDNLDPNALDTGAIHLRSSAYGPLWQLCSVRGLVVVADVHTHPGSWVQQSPVDRDHPMISERNHVAIILPNYGRTPTNSEIAGVYRYLGAYQWETLQTGGARARALYVGRWV